MGLEEFILLHNSKICRRTVPTLSFETMLSILNFGHFFVAQKLCTCTAGLVINIAKVAVSISANFSK